MNKTFVRFALSLLLLFSTAAFAPQSAVFAQAVSETADVGYSGRLKAIEDKVEARRKELGIPGLSLAIVQDGRVIFVKGFGYKDLENKAAVTPDTQFAIGSATKAFTALSALISQDEGKLSLDDSPKRLLPYFKMYDPDTDKNITIRDLLSHSSGLNRTDLAMITGKLTRAELIQVAGEAKPTAKLREKFQYQNLMFTAAGEAVASAQKMPWERFVATRIFAPLRMTNTSISTKEMEKARDHSFGYDYNFDTKLTRRLPYRDIDEVAPAGAINSTANDMARWLRFILNGGELEGKRLVSEKGFEEWLKPQMKIGGTMSYGLGWFLQDWNGMKVAQHGGNIDGFNSMVAMIPEKKLGFVLLTNVSASSLGNELMPIVWENILGENEPNEAIRLSPQAMEKLVGKYHLDAANIDVEVKVANEKLVMIVPGQPQYTLERTGEREFKLAGAPDGFAVKFTPAQGNAAEMELRQPNMTNTLKRLGQSASPTAADAPPSSARELIGKYESEISGKIGEVKETAGKVTFEIPGQPAFELVEKEKDVFALAPLPDAYRLKIQRNEKGEAAKFVIVQPEGEFVFRRLASDESASKITVDELMQKAIAASGGEANWKKLTSREMTMDIDFENQGVKATATSYAKAPNRSATITTMTALGKEIGKGVEVFDGTRGEELYSFAPLDVYSGKRLEDIRLGADFYGILDWKANYPKAEIVGRGKVGDELCYIVSFEPEKGTKFLEYYSAATFLLLKREGVISSSTSGISIPYSVVFSDYRDAGGVKLPFKSVNSSVANGTIVTTVKSVKHNVEIDDSVFRSAVLN